MTHPFNAAFLCIMLPVLLNQIFDVFTSRLTDRNSKVTLHALQAFCNMIPVLHSTLIPIISNVLGTLVNNLASRNLTLHSTAMTVLDLLSQHIGKATSSLQHCTQVTVIIYFYFTEAVHLVPSVANSSQFGNARIQPIMTRRLASETNISIT